MKKYDSFSELTAEWMTRPGNALIFERDGEKRFMTYSELYAVVTREAEEIRRTAERIDMASWGDLKYEEDPRFICTDYSSSARGSIILDYSDLGGKPYEIVNFDQRAVTAAGKGEDLKAMEDLLSSIADPDTRVSVEKSETSNTSAPMMNGFMGMGMMKMPTESGWTGKCGTLNTGKFCCECGMPRP